MRRAVSVLSIGALVAALWSGIASATPLPSTSISLSHELFVRCFHMPETGSPGETPLGPFAFQVVPAEVAATPNLAFDLGSVAIPRLSALIGLASPVPLASSAAYAPGGLPRTDAATSLQPSIAPPPTIGYYQEAQPEPTIAPSSSRFDLPATLGSGGVSSSPVLSPVTGFSAPTLGAGASSTLPQIGGDVTLPVRIGHVRLQTHADAGESRSDALAYNDTAVGGGATFDARLGKWKSLGVDVSSHYEHVTVDQPLFNASSLDGSSNIDLASDHLPVFVPAYADISKHTISAGLAVPVSRRMTAAVQIDSQHLLGGYGTPGLANLDANNMIYGARLTYQLKGTSAISLSAKQYRYQDNLIPLNAFTQTTANLNLTVKF